MSAFTGGIKRPQVQSQSGGNGDQQQRPYDRLVTVLGYNTDARTLACEEPSGKKFEVFVNLDEYARGEKTAIQMNVDRSKTWMGHSIDKQMEKNYPAGSKVILQRSRVHKKDNGQGMAVTEVQRVIGVPNPEPDKTFQGIFTLTARTDENRMKRVARLQHWQNRAIDLTNTDALEELKVQMDEAAARNGEKVGPNHMHTRPTIGVQFRAAIKTDRKFQVDNSPIFEVVETSIPFDWMPGPLDESGKEIKSQAHPIKGEEMLDLAPQFYDYMENHPQFKEAFASGEVIVEACPYKSYPASNNKQLQLTFGEPARDAHAEKNPLYQLSHRKSYVDFAQTELIQGRNYAVNGIVQISPNKLEKIGGKPVEIDSYWINNVHANHTTGHVMAMVRTSEGFKAEPHANLKLIFEKKAEGEGAPAAVPAAPARTPAASAPAPAPTAAPARPAPQPQVDMDDDFDPFASPEAASRPSASRARPFSTKKD